MPGMGNQGCGAGELSPVSPACMEMGTLAGWEGHFTDNLGLQSVTTMGCLLQRGQEGLH